MRIFFYIVLTSLVFSFYCLANEPDKTLHQQCLYPTVGISTPDDIYHGTGVIIRSDKIADKEYVNIALTAAHVVNSYDDCVIKVYDYQDWSNITSEHSYLSSIYARDTERDLVISVFVSEEKMPTAQIDIDCKLYIGNEIFHIGCGSGDEPRLDYGKITGLHRKDKIDKDYKIRTSAHTIPGDSGGPLFNKYQVIGICHSIRSSNKLPIFNISYYTPISYMKNWSDEESGAFDFVWKEKISVPKMASWERQLNFDYAIKSTNKD